MFPQATVVIATQRRTDLMVAAEQNRLVQLAEGTSSTTERIVRRAPRARGRTRMVRVLLRRRSDNRRPTVSTANVATSASLPLARSLR
jgi:hypothetical protein